MRDVPVGTRASKKQPTADAFSRHQQARWPYTEFTRSPDARSGSKITCRHCDKKLSCKNITRLKQHLLNRNLCPDYLDYALQHGEGNKYVLEALHKEGKRTSDSADAATVEGASPGSEAWQQGLTRLLLHAITTTGVGYAWIDHPTVVSFFAAALPDFTLPSAAQLAVLGGPCGSPGDVARGSTVNREGLQQGVPQVITPPQQQAASPSQLVVQPLTTLALAGTSPQPVTMAQPAPVTMVSAAGGVATGPVMHAVAMAPADVVMQSVPMAGFAVQALQPVVQAVQPVVQAVQPVVAPMQQEAAAAMQAAQATLQAVQQANAQTNAVLAGMGPGTEATISPPVSEPVMRPPQPPVTMGDPATLPQLQPVVAHIPMMEDSISGDAFLTTM